MAKSINNLYRLVLIILLSMVFLMNAQSQETFDNIKHKSEFIVPKKPEKRVGIPFKLVNNLVVLELNINGSQLLNFILDSGVGTMLITELPNMEEITLNRSRIVMLAGLGIGEPKRAYLSEGNQITFNNVIGNNIEILFLLDESFNLSEYMGMFVHGLIGYDIFANFAVEIDYLKEIIFLYHPEYFKEKFKKLSQHSKWNEYPISIENKKPYMDLQFKNTASDSFKPIKLLIDSGSSSAFSFYAVSSAHIKIPEQRLPVLIGVGLSGDIPGVLGQIAEVKFNDHLFKKPVVSYPDSAAVGRAMRLSDRNGSLGGDVLKRFKIIFHYQKKSIFLQKNKLFNKNFSYNRSGLNLTTPIPNLPVYFISHVRDGSVADLAGIKKEDRLIRINGIKVEQLSLSEILDYFERNATLYLVLEREEKKLPFTLVLKNELD